MRGLKEKLKHGDHFTSIRNYLKTKTKKKKQHVNYLVVFKLDRILNGCQYFLPVARGNCEFVSALYQTTFCKLSQISVTFMLVLNPYETRHLRRESLLHQAILEKQFASWCKSFMLDCNARHTDLTNNLP